jgi:predicted secreted protein
MRTVIILLIGMLPIGGFAAADTTDAYDRVTLSVNAEKRVANDTIVAQLYSEREGEKASQAASEVNQAIDWALNLSRGVAQVSAQTADYHSQPVYRDQRVIGWRVRQSITLESRDATRLSELVGELQERLAMSSITYNISPGLRADTEDGLIAQALASFGRRAQLITKELARSSYRIVRLDVVTSETPAHPIAIQRMAMSMEADAAVSPPVMDGGTQVVRVRVNGIIELELN